MLEFVSEALRMRSLDHPNVMSLIGICCSSDPVDEQYHRPMIVLPYMVLKDLKTYLRKERHRFQGPLMSLNLVKDESNLPRDVLFSLFQSFFCKWALF